MTEEYKERIIKYLTNNYNKDISPARDAFIAEEPTLITLQHDYSTYFDKTQGYIQGKDGKGNNLEIGFVYGYKGTKGVIAIVDANFEIIQVIDEYNTGTSFNKFLCLNIDITNGNVYGLDQQGNNTRFILLNNFLVKTPAQQDYEVKLRNSYFLELQQRTAWEIYVDKNPNSALYVIIGVDNDFRPYISTYKVEVGSVNELINYTFPSGSSEPSSAEVSDYEILWSGDSYNIMVGARISNTEYRQYTLTDTDEYIQLDFLKTITGKIIWNYKLTNDAVYFMCTSVGYPTPPLDDLYIYKCDYNDTSTLKTIFYKSFTGYQIYWFGGMLKKNNYIYLAVPYYNTTGLQYYRYMLGVIDKEYNEIAQTTGNFIYYGGDEEFVYGFADQFYVISSYNLLTYKLLTRSNVTIQMKQIFNENNWNYVTP